MVPQVGALKLLGDTLTALAGASYRLLSIAPVPQQTDTWATYSPYEMTFTGYAPQVAGPWTTPVLSGNNAISSPVTPPGFTNNGLTSVTPAGYALVDADGSTLLDVGLADGSSIPPTVTLYLTHSLALKGD